MSALKVVVTVKTDRQWPDRIAGLSPNIQLADATEATRAELRYQHFGEGEPPRTEILDGMLADAEVMYAMYVPPRLLSRAPRLKWLHTVSAGVEHLAGSGILESQLVITNSRGASAFPIAEHVLLFMVMFVKNMPALLSSQRQRQWKRLPPFSLEGKTVGVVGLGSIGSEVARLAKAFRMRVVAIRRSATRKQERCGDADAIYPPQDLKALLGESDYVVLTLPVTTETRRLIGEAELRAMKPTAYLINVSRGSIVDGAALVAALQQGRIAGAGLDVTDPEPLPPESPLWGMSNVIITPHLAGEAEGFRDRSAALFYDNLKRYLAGQPLLNVVDKAKGY